MLNRQHQFRQSAIHGHDSPAALQHLVKGRASFSYPASKRLVLLPAPDDLSVLRTEESARQEPWRARKPRRAKRKIGGPARFQLLLAYPVCFRGSVSAMMMLTAC